MQPTLARFGDDEWNPTLLLLMDLLRTASSEAAEELLQDRKFIEELVLGMVFAQKEDMHEGDKITKAQHARIEVAVANAMSRASSEERAVLVRRMSEIASAAKDRLALVSTDDGIRHARLDHEPPVMTLREFDKIFEAWRNDTAAANLTALLSKHATSFERTQSDVLEACALALLRRRAELIDNASDTFGSTEVQQLLQRMEAHSALLEQLIVDHNVLGDTRIASRVTILLAMRTQTAQFTNRLSDAMYAANRQTLREQLFRASAYLRDRAADVLKELKPWDRQTGGANIAGAAELNETRERLHTVFSEFLCDSALERFRRAGGVAAVGNFLLNPAETWLMFSAGTPFQRPDWRARLLLIAQERDEIIAQNFFVYLETLMGDRGLSRSALASDASLVVPAWEAASRVRPQPNMRGQVVQLVKHLREAVNDNDSIAMPSWVESIQDGSVESSSDTGSPERDGPNSVE